MRILVVVTDDDGASALVAEATASTWPGLLEVVAGEADATKHEARALAILAATILTRALRDDARLGLPGPGPSREDE